MWGSGDKAGFDRELWDLVFGGVGRICMGLDLDRG